VNYDAALDRDRLHDEGRYRTFTSTSTHAGPVPHAVWNKYDGSKGAVTVWCNDYLGMGQHRMC
jgi:5-aminolevulinate synthase